jgi:hypothetical protein
MSARRRLANRSAALLAALLFAVAALPGIASAAPAGNGPGPRGAVSAQVSDSASAPTVRTVTKDDGGALPIALAGAALLIAIAGTGYAVARTMPQRHQLRGQH